MKVLPDYLINYMPYMEDAIEELRLSVFDHAYDMMQCLDVDELSADMIRQKLELYNIKVENMTESWLPNGRFYRLYPYIKHHRTRKNTLNAITKSGGQFEGLWSNNFRKKETYNFKSTTVKRHYEVLSDMDGYFYISGDVSRNQDGTIKSSAVKALDTDILIKPALPAGYTYLYIPWPRPHYPSDSSYFYNVHMLDYDRLHYAASCDHMWYYVTSNNDGDKIYYCPDNTLNNRYCKVTNNDIITDDDIKYCNIPNPTDPNHGWSTFDESDNAKVKGDRRYIAIYDTLMPASMRYNWKTGIETPYRMPYQFDYHYMGDTYHKDNDGDNPLGKWPITEIGVYLDNNGNQTDNPEKAVKYIVQPKTPEDLEKPEILTDPDAIFPTACYSHLRYRTSAPTRDKLQSFEPYMIGSCGITSYNNDYKDVVAGIVAYTFNFNMSILAKQVNDHTINSLATPFDAAKQLISSLPALLPFNVNNDDSYYSDKIANFESLKAITLSGLRGNVELNLKIVLISLFRDTLSVLYNASIVNRRVDSWILALKAGDSVILPYNISYSIDYIKSRLSPYCGNISINSCEVTMFVNNNVNTIDENCYTDIYGEFKLKPGPYRHDLLCRKAYKSRNIIKHAKSYKSVWSEESPIFDMMQSVYKTDNGVSSDGEITKHSLYQWTHLKQSKNVPTIEESSYYGEAFVKDNNPHVSEVTIESYSTPTVSRMNSVYAAYTNYGINQGLENRTLSDTTTNNILYNYNATSSDSIFKYDPTLQYTLLSLNSIDTTHNNEQIIYDDSNIKAYIEGCPSDNKLYINKNNDTAHGESHNYITLKASNIHRLWMTKDKSNLLLSGRYNILYNDNGSDEIYYYLENNKAFNYNILGYYDSNNKKLDYTNNANLKCLRVNIGSGNYKYVVSSDELFKYSQGLKEYLSPAYVLFTLSVTDGEVEDATFTNTFIRTPDNEYTVTDMIPEAGLVNINDSYISYSSFDENGYRFAGSGTSDNAPATLAGIGNKVLSFVNTNGIIEDDDDINN